VSNSADIRDIQVLGDLKNAFGRFGEDVLQILASLQKEFEEIQEKLQERQDHWQREIDVAEDRVHAARRSLSECESSGYYDEEGDYQAPNCSSEEDEVQETEKHLAECEVNLETVKQWRHRIESSIADFQNEIHRLSNLASTRTGSAQAFLANKLEILNRYISGSSSVVGISALQGQSKNDKLNKDSPEPSNTIDYSANSLASILDGIGLNKKQFVTPEDMVILRDALKKGSPSLASERIESVVGIEDSICFTEENIRGVVQEMLNYLPPRLADSLPKLKIGLRSMKNGGSYGRDGIVFLNPDKIGTDMFRFRKTLYHEMMHWVHLEGPQGYRDLVSQHYERRTNGEATVQIPDYADGTIGKLDQWYEAYAGRIYEHQKETELGSEVPTRYIEFLAFSPERMANLWNDAHFRETMKIVLQGVV